MMTSHLLFAKRLTTLMDTKFEFFGIRFGLDPMLDFWPGFGSVIGAIISCYLFWIAYKLKVPSRVYWRMGRHIVLDLLLGELPFVGFIFDMFYRSNEKNLALLSQYVKPNILEGVVVKP